ncbi:MAG: YlxR family protein [Erysipelotrichaceae bacterium]|nr:YlxR family protein [Erysipelotrichaceae bacterium]
MSMARKIPLRRCVATGEQLPKKELIRVVRNKEGEVFVDPTGKMNGRGAYLKCSKEAIDLARKKGVLDKSLEIHVPESIYEELMKYAKQ